MKTMTGVLAGLATVCKTVRDGFDSRPRLHIFLERPKSGIRMPHDYGKADLMRMLLEHHRARIDAETKLDNTRAKLIEARKEISKLKRSK